MSKTIQFSTGLIIAAGYANKLRRTMIAVTKGLMKPEEAAREAARLNMILFDVLRENGVEKDDVVRIRFNFKVIEGSEENKIVVDWDTFTIEIYKKDKVLKKDDIEGFIKENTE
jgi:hypothetical protein